MTVAEFIERLSKQNKENVIYYDYGRGLKEVSWDDFVEMLWIFGFRICQAEEDD